MKICHSAVSWVGPFVLSPCTRTHVLSRLFFGTHASFSFSLSLSLSISLALSFSHTLTRAYGFVLWKQGGELVVAFGHALVMGIDRETGGKEGGGVDACLFGGWEGLAKHLHIQ